MGYTTRFEGKFDLSRDLTQEELSTLDELRKEGVTHPAFAEKKSLPPQTLCQWTIVRPNEEVSGGEGTFTNDSDHQVLAWDQGEKFYCYVQWLRYLVNEYFAPWGVLLNGEVEWSGEDEDDLGKIYLQDNFMEVYEAIVHVEYVKVKEEE